LDVQTRGYRVLQRVRIILHSIVVVAGEEEGANKLVGMFVCLRDAKALWILRKGAPKIKNCGF
jgi:hypothetical protein